MEKSALIIVDAQRGFMPDNSKEEQSWRSAWGERLLSENEIAGYGELPVPEGQQIINPINRLIVASERLGNLVATTQDWHPYYTAHFAKDGIEPDYKTTWPRHCVGGTPGADFSHGLDLPANYRRFIKGTKRLKPGEPDTSYSGYNAVDPLNDERLLEFLAKNKVRKVAIGGLALDYCVGQTALDLRKKANMKVAVISDATRAVAPETGQAMVDQFHEEGITYTDSASWIAKQMKTYQKQMKEYQRREEKEAFDRATEDIAQRWGEYS